MPEPDFVIRAKDTVSIIRDVLEDENEDPVNISGATIRFHLAPLRGSPTPVLDAAATNDQVSDGSDGTRGKVSYAWAAGNTAVAGWYLGEWEVTFVGGTIQTYPNIGYLNVLITSEVA